MVKAHETINGYQAQEKIDAAISRLAKFQGVCSFFGSPQDALDAVKKIEIHLGKNDEIIILPIDSAAQSLVSQVSHGDAETIDLASVGLSAFCIPFVIPGRAGVKSDGL